MKILLRIEDIHFIGKEADWWKHSDSLQKILFAFITAGIWNEFVFYGQEGFKRHKLSSIDDFVKESQNFIRKNYSITNENNDKPSAKLDLRFDAFALTIHASFDEKFIKEYKGNLLENLKEIIVIICRELEPDTLTGPFINIEMIGAVYPHVRPLRYHNRIIFGTLVHAYSKKFHASHKLGNPEEVGKILKADLPVTAYRHEHGDLVMYSWINELSDVVQLTNSCSRQEQWLVKVIDPPISPNYNQLGDYLSTPYMTQKDTILSFYDANRKYGYKAIVVFPDGTVDEELFSEISEWIKTRKLPDGREILVLFLITQSRESALLIYTRAKQLGVKAVYYADNKGQLWDPFPVGLWIDNA